MLITSSLPIDAVILLITVAVSFFIYIKWTYSKWMRADLDYVEPSFPFGNFWETVKEKITFGEEIEKHYFDLKSKGAKHGGLFFFFSPVYVPIDPDLVKYILQVDFSHFQDRILYYNEKNDPLSAHLLSSEGIKWRNLRAKLSPTFTSGKIKMMFPLVMKTSEELITAIDSNSSSGPIEFKDILARLTTDIIGTCAFGLECNSLRDPDTKFRREGKKFFQSSGWRRFVQFLGLIYPEVMKTFGARFTPKSVEDFFMGVVRDTVKYREENNVKRKDFMQLLINLKNIGAASEEEAETTTARVQLSDDELAAQAFVFFVAGFETSSTTMSFCLYEIAQNETIQQKMRDEINSLLAKHNGEFTYEAMLELHYMENVIHETLRKYPPAPILTRRCTKDYNIPNTNVTLLKGDNVFISVQGLQHDPEHYPKPDLFDPDRFTDENKRTRHAYTFLPFGEGPRICIGSRFAIMQSKVGLTILLQNYKLKLNSRTQVPLVLDPNVILNAAAGGIWIDAEKT